MQDATAHIHDLESAAHRGSGMEVRVWLRLLATTAIIEKEVRNRLAAEFDTTLPRFDVMAQLEREPDGLTMGMLSRRLMVSNGNVTRLIDRLVEEGVVDRVPVPGDRRASIVRLTEVGRADFARMAEVHHAWIREAMADLDDEDIRGLYDILGDLKASARRASTREER